LHADCGDCHLSLPDAVGGGLIKGHTVMARAPMEDSCALCHGSRAGGEYLGHFEGIEPDIHFEAGMHCLDCHKNDLHGDGRLYQTRWQVAGRAQCTDCHKPETQAAIPGHDDQHADVACQVCHAQPYQNCFDCHTGEEDGRYFRRAGAKELLLKLGKNTDPDYPFGVVTLRNNPVARESFAYLGEGLLPGFDDHPTWKTAAPHNIRRITAQNAKCENCHADPDLFLNPGDLDPDGAAANSGSILIMNEGEDR
jgi:thiosulfate/3-mercaptopyruvate sulfurtransferase